MLTPEAYGQRLAEQLCQSYFAAHPGARLDGPALLAFTPVRQINLLVLRQLLGHWQAQAQALRSPWFDYEAAPVQTALAQLLGVLSRHLALDRTALQPLLARAAAATLGLALDPGPVLAGLLPPAAASREDLANQARYLDQARPFWEGFVAALPASPATFEAAELRQRLADYLPAHRAQLPSLAQTVAALAPLLPLTEADLRAEAPPAPGPLPATPTPVAAGVPAALATPAPAPAVASATPADAAAPAIGASPPAESLRDAISINQRYSFINELFEGENMAYHAFVQALDAQPTLAAARAALQAAQAAHPTWSRQEAHVAKLHRLLERKFGEG